MKKVITISDAATLAINSQWLQCGGQLASKETVLSTLEHLGYVQIDTLSVVERAHHHVLWSRMGGYKQAWLSDLLHGKKIFEYWSHAAAYLPMKDFRFSLIRKSEYAKGKSHWFAQDKKVKRYVLNRIKREGPLQSKDFEAPEENRQSWYYWKPAKRALEQLFMEGKLMVSHRQGFQKVYDLTENILPTAVNTALPTKMEYAMHLAEQSIRAHGILTEKEMYYQRGGWSEYVSKAVRRMLKEGQVTEWRMEGHEAVKCYCAAGTAFHPATRMPQQEVEILSPFDNLLIQRSRLKRLFDFDYTIECYLPEHKRKFGYFTLPVLYGNSFIARMDPKADRQQRVFYIKNLVFEKGIQPDDEMLTAFAGKLKQFAAFNGCIKIEFGKSNVKNLQGALKKLTS
ncbi:MAG: winged helix DNA-binding domain-containing protein [Chitinophagales bacterium]|nr:winged helix DNA-binding domain-containing protein [Chitinophagales bacterium]